VKGLKPPWPARYWVISVKPTSPAGLATYA